jgi:hypothetical protein
MVALSDARLGELALAARHHVRAIFEAAGPRHPDYPEREMLLVWEHAVQIAFRAAVRQEEVRIKETALETALEVAKTAEEVWEAYARACQGGARPRRETGLIR